MAKAPSNTGINTGSAQVFNTGVAAQTFMQQKDQEAQQEALRQKKLQESLNEVRGNFEKLKGTKLWETRDGEEFRKLLDGVASEFTGKWEKVAQVGSPEWTKYQERLREVEAFGRGSMEAKAEADKWDKLINSPEHYDKYKDEDRADYAKFVTTPAEFKQLSYSPNLKIDLDKEFTERVYKPVELKAKNNAKAYGGFTDEKNYSGKTIKASEEDKQAAIDLFLADPKVVSQINYEFKDQAAKEGYDDPVSWWIDKKKGTLDINVSEYKETGRSAGGKKKEFNPNNIVTDMVFEEGKKEQGTPELDMVYGWFGGAKGSKIKGNSYQTEGVKGSVPGSVNMIDKEGKKVKQSTNMAEATYAYPTTMYYTGDIKNGNYKIVEKGTKGAKEDIFVFGDIATDDVTEDGKPVWKTVLRPFYEVQELFDANGYPVEEIKQGLTTNSPANGNKKYTPAQEAGINSFAKTNGLSREEAIQILIDNGKL